MIIKDEITRNIIKTVAVYLLLQTVLYLVLVTVYGIYRPVSLVFYAITIAFHLLLSAFLIRMKKYFLLLESGKQLSSINLANLLTLTRLSLLPTICYLLFLLGEYPIVPVLLVITIIAFLTDLLDGALSRRTHQTTEIGKYLDSISDYAMLIVISIAYYIFNLLPDWFFIIVMARLFLQTVAVTILLLGYGIKSEATISGKVAVFATMTLYALEILILVNLPIVNSSIVKDIAEYTVGVILVVSLVDKLMIMMRKIRDRDQEPGAGEPSEPT